MLTQAAQAVYKSPTEKTHLAENASKLPKKAPPYIDRFYQNINYARSFEVWFQIRLKSFNLDFKNTAWVACDEAKNKWFPAWQYPDVYVMGQKKSQRKQVLHEGDYDKVRNP